MRVINSVACNRVIIISKVDIGYHYVPVDIGYH